MIKPDPALVLPASLGRVHFVGIGGSGMSGIARMMHARGMAVTGSDRSESAAVTTLRELGIEVQIGHDARNVGDADTLVVTGALWLDNPEYQEALSRGMPVLHRAHALAWLVREERLIAVAGAHGKSTTTAMLVTALRALDLDPSFVNGAVIQAAGTSAAWGEGELFVVEADESDGSFLLYDTAVGIVTNIDTDHLDHYGSADALADAFVEFASRVHEFVVLSADDEGTVRVRERLDGAVRVLSFGEAPGADVRLAAVSDEGPVAYTVEVSGVSYDGALGVPGRHNALNAAGVVAILVGLGIEPAAAVGALDGFSGTQRRFESHGLADGVRLYDDYAHHPTEVAAALQTARSVVGAGRVIAIHQPHLYSRTQAMAAEFAAVYERDADHTVVLDVHGAREDPIPGVTGALVVDRFADASKVDYRPEWSQAAQRIAEIARPGDIVMTLSCGDVYRIIPLVREALDHRATGAVTP
ncbi:UDP-N-acetylmuramate--L-alanine ligase [Microcella sp.]|uniref:UDP-N-acetylmuramate--L-alanine ligase n=1 Tax=Microcella sp. TaxID=1913979 RepID=UPI00256440A0|nr:UDP-N-acetylmuramate--L-alanine ligase [Microcella sp.]MBX9470473.1 UDP-N-acetylmuramate--L-alanine ligase [Microcella sp.]MBX9470478.1 UDP-N-acetylmuramate--L-alanine ligase [Microcella sp.]